MKLLVEKSFIFISLQKKALLKKRKKALLEEKEKGSIKKRNRFQDKVDVLLKSTLKCKSLV